MVQQRPFVDVQSVLCAYAGQERATPGKKSQYRLDQREKESGLTPWEVLVEGLDASRAGRPKAAPRFARSLLSSGYLLHDV